MLGPLGGVAFLVANTCPIVPGSAKTALYFSWVSQFSIIYPLPDGLTKTIRQRF